MFLPFKPLVTTVVLESYRAVVANTVSDRTSKTLRNSTLIIGWNDISALFTYTPNSLPKLLIFATYA